ncbi:hypothetical protein Tco_0529122 [Tanacetum coccineum]
MPSSSVEGNPILASYMSLSRSWRSGTVPEEIEWDCSKPSVGFGGDSLVSSETSLSLALQPKEVETLSPSDCLQQSYGPSIQYHPNAETVAKSAGWSWTCSAEEVVLDEKLNHKSEHNSPSHRKRVFQDRPVDEQKAHQLMEKGQRQHQCSKTPRGSSNRPLRDSWHGYAVSSLMDMTYWSLE